MDSLTLEMEVEERRRIQERVDHWFTYHPPKKDQPVRYERFRAKFRELATDIVNDTPIGADQTAALRQLQHAMMMVNACIACNE